MNATGEESARIAWDQWRQCALPSTQPADLPSPAAFDAAVEHVSPSDVLEKVRASADVGRQLAWLQEDLALGVERIYLHNVAAGHQEHFIDACGTRILPELARG
ncbi:MAG: hypothetical protein H0U94_16545 [Acidobacteria bacterium]|nr:hypothetical protein [Acidobacteriota bacterium]